MSVCSYGFCHNSHSKKMLLVNNSLFLCSARDLKYTVYFSRLFHRTLLSKKLKKKRGGGRRKNKKITKNIVVLRHSEKFCMFRFQKPQNLTSEGHNELTFQIKKKTWPIFEVFFTPIAKSCVSLPKTYIFHQMS